MSRSQISCELSETRSDLKNYAALEGRVLVVEAAPGIQRITARILSRLGLQVTAAGNGREAVEIALLARDAAYGFDLVVIEAELPVMDGVLTAGALRNNGIDEPIIVVARCAARGMGKRYRDTGCNAFIVSSVTFDPIYETLKRYLPTTTSLV